MNPIGNSSAGGASGSSSAVGGCVLLVGVLDQTEAGDVILPPKEGGKNGPPGYKEACEGTLAGVGQENCGSEGAASGDGSGSDSKT